MSCQNSNHKTTGDEARTDGPFRVLHLKRHVTYVMMPYGMTFRMHFSQRRYCNRTEDVTSSAVTRAATSYGMTFRMQAWHRCYCTRTEDVASRLQCSYTCSDIIWNDL